MNKKKNIFLVATLLTLVGCQKYDFSFSFELSTNSQESILSVTSSESSIELSSSESSTYDDSELWSIATNLKSYFNSSDILDLGISSLKGFSVKRDTGSYYTTVNSDLTGESLLNNLRTLNSKKRTSLVGYKQMFKNNNFASTDPGLSSGKLTSFYSGKSVDSGSCNREHVWPDSRGGGLVEDDIHMPRPTLNKENGARGNSFYVEGKKTDHNGWDPAKESFGDPTFRGDAARIIFYCVVASSDLELCDKETIGNTETGYRYTMGKLTDLLKWHLAYPVTEREQVRNDAAQKLQGNRNPFIDHPEWAIQIWGKYNSSTKSICDKYAPGIIY